MMEQLIQQVPIEMKEVQKNDSMECEFRAMSHTLNCMEYKLDAISNQLASLIEFRAEAMQEFSEIKRLLRLLVNKSADTERELYLIRGGR